MMTNTIIEKGAVTFLDVLGWKGKWKDSYESIYTLKNLINMTETTAKKVHEEVIQLFKREASYFKELRGATTEILSISDTIVIFTKGPAIPTLLIHARICREILPESIKQNVPLRGATSYGDYSRDGNIMIGPAIDEAASWHETTNWIGVSLTPSGLYAAKEEDIEEWTEYSVPYKKKVSPMLNKCVKWYLDPAEAFVLFEKMGPHVPEIAEKYLNTFLFLKAQEKLTEAVISK
ncbi:hypothetical protein [Bacillus sp. MMSF_3328]|uniref:hypothetical protein n=1 Tax=Bacillus sp. MMSF_3328 TaxID=3047080 RepID=UPI0027402740|nr:hypothetical protein [Bacillus sp. MMSF_3328]